MKRWRAYAAAALSGLLLSSCSLPYASISELMEAPKLSDEQASVNRALEMALGTDSFILKYPRSGDYRSAFVFYDIDLDDVDEAIVFYQLNIQDSITEITILDKTNGEWRSVCTTHSQGDWEVDAIRFENVESSEYKNIIISWQQNASTNKILNIYTYQDRKLNEPYQQTYVDSMIRDFNNDGLIEIMLISKRRSNPYRVSYISWNGESIRETDSLSLGEDVVNGFSHLLYGKLPDGRQALYVDVGLYNAQYGTEIITLEDNKLTPQIRLADLDPADIAKVGAENWVEPPAHPNLDDKEGGRARLAANAVATMRAENIPCADINGDGVIEIPSSRPMLGYEGANEDDILLEELKYAEAKYLTTFGVLRDGVIAPVMNACVNLEAGYMVRIPDRWLDTVTVYSENNVTQWQFYQYGGSLADLSTELLRIRRILKTDSQDRFETNPILLSGSPTSLYQYYGYIPPTEENKLAITEAELKEMFLLLPQ